MASQAAGVLSPSQGGCWIEMRSPKPGKPRYARVVFWGGLAPRASATVKAAAGTFTGQVTALRYSKKVRIELHLSDKHVPTALESEFKRAAASLIGSAVRAGAIAPSGTGASQTWKTPANKNAAVALGALALDLVRAEADVRARPGDAAAAAALRAVEARVTAQQAAWTAASGAPAPTVPAPVTTPGSASSAAPSAAGVTPGTVPAGTPQGVTAP